MDLLCDTRRDFKFDELLKTVLYLAFLNDFRSYGDSPGTQGNTTVCVGSVFSDGVSWQVAVLLLKIVKISMCFW